MKKMAIVLSISFALSPPMHPQEPGVEQSCMQACLRERPNVDLQRQELIALERETARAIQLGDTTFFHRVYSDSFTGVLSRGESVDKASFIAAVQSPAIKYESFTASDIKIRLYRDFAVATSTWSTRALLQGRSVSSQIRVLHVYLYSGGGYHVVASQTTMLPPYLGIPL
jgi:hypothetical protein